MVFTFSAVIHLHTQIKVNFTQQIVQVSTAVTIYSLEKQHVKFLCN